LQSINKAMTTVIDNKTYADLVVSVLPTAIQSKDEYVIMLENVNELMSRDDDSLSPEENRLLETLAILIEAYEDEHYPIEPCEPDKMLKMLMAENNYRQKDLLHIFGSSGIASEVINGKRSISKAHAKKLAEFFNVSIELFI
jgi:HTH-type transcriptional regulator / antitoxin HigA